MTVTEEPSRRLVTRPAAELIRIVFLTDIVTPYLAVVLESLAEVAELRTVFCSRNGTRGMDWTVELPFRHEVVGGLTIRRRRIDATDYYLNPLIISALERARPEVVISSGFSVPTLYAALYARMRRIPLIIQSDGTSSSERRLGIEQRASRRLLRRLAWGAVANSRPARRRFIELGFRRQRVLLAPHAIRIERYWDVARDRVTPGGRRLRLLSVGRLIPRKGCAWLLRAVAEARRTGADVELIMAGSGVEESSLKRLAADLEVPVSWRGFVDQPGLLALYGEADAFAFPTLDDPFGIVLIEAAAAGLPLISSAFAGATEELVREGVNGFVVDPTDTGAMAAAIARLADDPELRQRMGSASRLATRARTPAAGAAGYLRAAELALDGQAR